MIYGAPTKGSDGLYFVKVLDDDKKKKFIQLNRTKNLTLTSQSEVTINLDSEKNMQKVQDINELNIKTAVENSAEWFGKELPEDVVRAAYTASLVNDELTCDRIPQTRVFNSNQEAVDISKLKSENTCTVILELAGIWFAKKAFGPVWNLVQVKVCDDPDVQDLYPEEYIIADDDQ